MISFDELIPEQNFLDLPNAFYQFVEPQALSNPELVVASKRCAELLGIEYTTLSKPESLAILSGQTRFTSPSLAMKYTGHQFGYYNPDLGDGRGLLLGDIQSPVNEQRYDLHLKGAGTTPFSRQGDGRAVLRSSIREFLASEALSALGIPSSRALAVINTSTTVYRESVETGATLLRVTPSHIRFGHFEFARHSGNISLLEQLSDYVIKRYFPCFQGLPNRYADLFQIIAKRTASMIAKWQAYGFAHGVMNTDNMSVLGETFDFGPYGFLDAFNPGHICNHSDHTGRYAFDKQPAIAHWNLSVLAHAMSPLVEQEALSDGIHAYNDVFNAEYLAMMKQKLGLTDERTEDQGLIFKVLNMLSQQNLDYSYFFRKLSQINSSTAYTHLRDMCVNRELFDSVVQALITRWESDETDHERRAAQMDQINPKFVLRNHLAQEAIEAAQNKDYSKVNTLHKVLESPYSEQPEFEEYAQLPPNWASTLEISCSS